MFDKIMFKLCDLIDNFFCAIDKGYERLKNNRIFSKRKRTKR